MNVIIVDDEGVVRDVLGTILSDNGFDVRTTGSGSDALQMLAEAPADFLITDFLMPNMSGAELLRKAKQATPGLKVVLMSGHMDFDGTIAQCAHDAYATFQKPFDFRQLIDLLAGPPPSIQS